MADQKSFIAPDNYRELSKPFGSMEAASEARREWQRAEVAEGLVSHLEQRIANQANTIAALTGNSKPLNVSHEAHCDLEQRVANLEKMIGLAGDGGGDDVARDAQFAAERKSRERSWAKTYGHGSGDAAAQCGEG